MLVSIVVPIYNTSTYLEECLDSISNQSFKNIEIILVNDGSTDDSGVIAEKYIYIDSRFKIIHLNNGGVSRARNKGIQIATGDFITFIDSDDIIDVYHIENMIKNMPGKDSLCICNYKRKFKDNDEIGINITINSSILKKSYLIENLEYTFGGYSWNKLYDLEVIKKNNLLFDEKIKICEDLLFSLQYIMLITGEIYYTNSATYTYLQRNNSAVSGFNPETYITSIIARKKCIDLLTKEMPEVLDIWKKTILRMCFSGKRRYLSEKIDASLYSEIIEKIIDEMYTEVFYKSNAKEKFRLFMYKHHMKLLVIIKRICGEK